jgi:hypothetical protein
MPVHHVPNDRTREIVLHLAAAGIDQQRICRLIQCGQPKLVEYYREELDTGYDAINELAVSILVRTMKAENTREAMVAAIYWTKARMKWSERHEHTGADGAPLTSYVVRAPSPVESAEEWLRTYAPQDSEM